MTISSASQFLWSATVHIVWLLFFEWTIAKFKAFLAINLDNGLWKFWQHFVNRSDIKGGLISEVILTLDPMPKKVQNIVYEQKV